MKFDQETLVKQRFWLLLGGAVLLVVVSFFLMTTTVRSSITKEKEGVSKVLKELTGFADPKSSDWVDLAKRVADEKEEQKTIVWQAAAGQQADLMTWPPELEDKYHFQDGLFAKEITATRKPEEKGGGGEGAKEEPNRFHGTITQVDDNGLTVAGGDKKTLRFQRTPDVKVQITAEPEVKDATFSSLKEGDRVTVTYEVGKYFGDKLTDNERFDYATWYNSETKGKNQLKEILAIVDPLNAKGEGVVQFPGWVWNPDQLPPAGAPYFRYVAGEWKKDYDFSDEAWMAQEDLWVQRDIYRLVRAANDSVAKFQGEGGDKKDQDYVFTNPYWELTAKVTKDRKLKLKIKNLLDQRQDLDVTLKLQLVKEGNPVLVRIEGEARPPAGTPANKGRMDGDTFEVERALEITPQGVFAAEQVLTWRTAAVKRIDYISMGVESPSESSAAHRMYAKKLKPFREEKKAEEPKAEQPNAEAPRPGPGRRFRGEFPGAGPGAQQVGQTPNGLIRDRYLDVTAQARRMPVAVVLIVDQQHVERVQAAFANSKLRFLTTQVVMNRYPQSVRPPETSEQVAGAEAPGGRPERAQLLPGARPFRPAFAGLPRGGVVSPGGVRGSAGDTTSPGMGDEQESNVELVLYGIVSLYERFPPRPAAQANPNP
jgi:hypothetical protein